MRADDEAGSPTLGAWESAPSDVVEERITARMLAVARFAADRIPFYAWFYAHIRDDLAAMRTRDEFRTVVPFVTKDDVVRFQKETGRIPWTPGHRQLHLTSGTSGAGREWYLRDARDLVALGMAGAEGLVRAGILAGDRVLLTIPYSQTMAGPYFQETCRAAGAVPVAAFAVETRERLEYAQRFDVSAIVATPSHVHRLARAAEEEGVDPATRMPRLRALILSGEPFGQQWARQAERFWGATVHEGWGATQTLGVAMTTCERGVLPADDEEGRGFLHGIGHRCHVEVVDPDGREVAEGDRGEVVVTTLRSTGMPAIRFRMGDEVRRLPSGVCPCGREGLAVESGTISRVDDMIKVRGMNMWPQAVDQVVFARDVADYRGVISTDDNGREQILLRVATECYDDQWRVDLESALRHQVGLAMQVEPVHAGSFADNTFKSRRWEDRRDVQGG